MTITLHPDSPETKADHSSEAAAGCDDPTWLEGERQRSAARHAREGRAVGTTKRDKLQALAASALERFAQPERPDLDPPACPAPAPRPAPPARRRRQAPGDGGGHLAVDSSGKASAPPEQPRRGLSRNPRMLRYWRQRMNAAQIALVRANVNAERNSLHRLDVPRELFDMTHDVCDDTRAVAGALEWVRQRCGPSVALEIEAAGLYRVPGKLQRDDWSCARARRKTALLVMLLMSPFELPRTEVTGSRSTESIVVTAGVPQTLLVKMMRSSLREPYCIRTLQRDLAEIDECTDLLLRWRTPRAKAQSWECNGQSEGVVNRYCIRAGLIRSQWNRSHDVTEAMIKQVRLQMASWLVWTPPPRRGEQVPIVGQLAPS